MDLGAAAYRAVAVPPPQAYLCGEYD